MGTKRIGWQLVGSILFGIGLGLFIASVVFSVAISVYVFLIIKAALSAQAIAVFALLLAICSSLMSIGHSLEEKHSTP